LGRLVANQVEYFLPALMTEKEKMQTPLWKSLTKLDWLAVSLCLGGGIAELAETFLRNVPGIGFLQLVAVLSGVYLVYRVWTRWRGQLLWSLRNRLIVAYLFIAVVPIILLLILANLAGQIIYSQLGAYLLYHDLHDRIEMVADSSAHLAAAETAMPASIDQKTLERGLANEAELAQRAKLPGLGVNFHVNEDFFRSVAGPGNKSFSGLLQHGNELRIVGMQEADSPRGKQFIELSLPVTSEFLEGVATDLGPIDLTLSERVEGESARSAVGIGTNFYRKIGRILTRKRVLPPAQGLIDPVVDGFSKLEATYTSTAPSGATVVERGHPVFVFFKARDSALNHRIFAAVGDLSGARIFGLQFVAGVFLLLEIVALVIGVVLTRAITQTVADLYRATQFVQEGDFTHRVRVERRDQLGMLGESFNTMTSSIGRLVNEQKQLQRLENEISIARQVQDQLFPQNLPDVEGIEVEAICRAARSVSGDYYDFIQLDTDNVAIAIADISGKGISAALLMASLQAALRSQLLTPGSESVSTAELVGRLNKHLVRNTGDDRFATFLLVVYNTATRKLRYTNAGHLPGFCLSDGKAIHLAEGGIVLGVVEEYDFQEGCVNVPAGAVLIGYSDGLIEPENAYGEQFGISRLEEAAQRLRHSSVKKIAEGLMVATEEWAGAPEEQADDMTVIVAKLR
jgi:sigma-B regulation protein RsbU (phosphoserine phosphatase)